MNDRMPDYPFRVTQRVALWHFIRSLTAVSSIATVIFLMGFYPNGEAVLPEGDYFIVYLLIGFAIITGYRPLFLSYKIQRQRW